MRPVPRLRPALAGTAALLLGATALGTAAPAGAATGRELDLRFETTTMRANTGVSALHVRTVTAHGGTVARSGGSTGNGVRLPAYRTSSPPLAGITAADVDGGDALSPGTAAFSFGADFALDATSQGGGADNGNNLIQRGLFDSGMQYKIDIDKNRPACRVKGSSGTVEVRASMTAAAGTWYRAKCDRSGSTVTLTVVRLSDGRRWTAAGRGATGSVRAKSAATPLSVGVKVSAGGAIVTSAPDQFNGRVDNAFYNVK